MKKARLLNPKNGRQLRSRKLQKPDAVATNSGSKICASVVKSNLTPSTSADAFDREQHLQHIREIWQDKRRA